MINFKSLKDTSKKFRVWWWSDTHLTHYYIDSPQEAFEIVDIIAIRELDDDNVGYNAWGLEELQEDECWFEWYDEEGYDIEHHYNLRNEGQ